MSKLTLVPMNKSNFDEAKVIMEQSFAASMKELPDYIGANENDEECLPSLDGILERTEATPLVFYLEEKMVGGAVLIINENGNNILELLFIDSMRIDKGIGYMAWFEIEKKYPKTKTWNTVTPTSLMRNVHFYVNKCGFHIIRVDDSKSEDLMFVFQKIMN